MKRIFTIIGARPQFIKAAAVSRRISQETELEEILVHTGQHYDANMSDVFFEEMSIPIPQYHLGIAGGSHGAMTGKMLTAIEDLLLAERPDLVLVFGDTNSTLAGALAAAKLHIPVAHIEAGLRSFNRKMPEEINRILTDHAADFLFTPTVAATENLVQEGFSLNSIIQSGDVMLDATLQFAEKARSIGLGASKLGLTAGEFVLATIHRQENTDSPSRLSSIIEGLSEVASRWPVVLPLHPRTKDRIEAANLTGKLKSIKVIDPVGYLEMVALEMDAAIIATDSGGVQKEAFFHKVPCVTLRDETEWVELVEAGWNTLAPPESSVAIREAIHRAYATRGLDISPYGDGCASDKIVSALKAGDTT